MEFILGQVVALVTFFGFPALQYLLLKKFPRREERPELWFLPRWGCRLVVHNITGKKKLSDIRYRALLRRRIPAGDGSSVATFEDQAILERDDFFLFPGTDWSQVYDLLGGAAGEGLAQGRGIDAQQSGAVVANLSGSGHRVIPVIDASVVFPLR